MTIKRAVDVILAAIAIVLTSPFWLVAALAVRFSSEGPVFHRAVRAGKDGASFMLLKFRTMLIAAANPNHPGITVEGDPRITRAGRILRRTKVDELPQLLNVIRGDMSLVGPRPEDPRYVARYTEQQRRILSVLPGITSPASLAFRDEEAVLRAAGANWEDVYVRRVMPEKIAIDLGYLDRRTIFTDMALLAKTAFGVVVRPRR